MCGITDRSVKHWWRVNQGSFNGFIDVFVLLETWNGIKKYSLQKLSGLSLYLGDQSSIKQYQGFYIPTGVRSTNELPCGF